MHHDEAINLHAGQASKNHFPNYTYKEAKQQALHKDRDISVYDK